MTNRHGGYTSDAAPSTVARSSQRKWRPSERSWLRWQWTKLPSLWSTSNVLRGYPFWRLALQRLLAIPSGWRPYGQNWCARALIRINPIREYKRQDEEC